MKKVYLTKHAWDSPIARDSKAVLQKCYYCNKSEITTHCYFIEEEGALEALNFDLGGLVDYELGKTSDKVFVIRCCVDCLLTHNLRKVKDVESRYLYL